MPGTILTHDTVMMCMHAGEARPTLRNPRLRISGSPVVTVSTPYVVEGCLLPPPPATPTGPCLTAFHITCATRVLSSGVPVLLRTSRAECIPTGSSLLVMLCQERVRAE